MIGKIVVAGAGILFVLGIITIAQYGHVWEWAIVGAIRSYVFWVIDGSFIAVLVGILKLFKL